MERPPKNAAPASGSAPTDDCTVPSAFRSLLPTAPASGVAAETQPSGRVPPAARRVIVHQLNVLPRAIAMLGANEEASFDQPLAPNLQSAPVRSAAQGGVTTTVLAPLLTGLLNKYVAPKLKPWNRSTSLST